MAEEASFQAGARWQLARLHLRAPSCPPRLSTQRWEALTAPLPAPRAPGVGNAISVQPGGLLPPSAVTSGAPRRRAGGDSGPER